MFNVRTPMSRDGRVHGRCSPVLELSSPHGYTPSLQERVSPTVAPTPCFRSEGCRSPAVQGFRPPPPIISVGQLIYPTDRDSPATPGLNTAIPSSPSPLAEARFGIASAGHTHRPSGIAPVARKLSTPCANPVAEAKPVARPLFSSDCGRIVEHRDPTTHEVISSYRCRMLLGAGGFAQVFEFEEVSTGISYACKVVERKNLARGGSSARFRMEVDIHSRMNHPNILRFIKSFQDEFYHYIILEQCSQESLMDLSKKRGAFNCQEIQYIMRQIVSAVEYMHNSMIIHRDLKLGNVLIDFEGNMKLGDFGFASEFTSPFEKKTTVCGTPNYLAPEVLACKSTGVGYGLEADIWSLGVLLYALVVGKPPFEAKDISATYHRIRKVDYSFPEGISIPEPCKDLIQWMLQGDPQKRPVPVQILAHSFLCLPLPPRTAPKSLVPVDGQVGRSRSERCGSRRISPPPVQAPATRCSSGVDGRADRFALTQNRMGPTDCEDRAVLQEAAGVERCGDEAASATAGGTLTTEKRNTIKPPPPTAMLQSCVSCSKYGFGFLTLQNGCRYPEAFLNDKTKLVFDRNTDTVLYYDRSRLQAVTRESRNHSPLLSEDLAKRGFCDELVVFRNASRTLVRRSENKDDGDRMEAAAAKKLAVIKFFLPCLECGTRDKRMTVLTCALRGWSPSWGAELFAPCRTGGERPDVVYVKDAVAGTLHELTNEHQDVDMTLLAARMSDYSFHVSMRCDAAQQSLHRPIYDGGEANVTEQQWSFDVLVYSGFHALMAFEDRGTRFAMSFEDLRNHTEATMGGKVYFAAGSTVCSKHITIPTPTLQAIGVLLRRVRCCANIVECF
ncbi:serine/threonine-protein kinase, putative [Trypanosoma brucei gambiense DAL972]|uniref:Serine/threonine-protein kinase, putative n=1 Tax=Trypanosoma brucei gambiense (strain MHOM/CI/86/DAL972) TaxID=679716 RepID=C9ZRI2_TRYB9|nr:serine/threonine-protein kinase, putative [Trypanosoma brucei gambiense DAL972]CBH12012.1 serine/threonine-protein kinase, putative [Trypanosoma brucei gambiense DAL972]|eukprot:XP_011774297.1 serine/threonine-protein kinase, putative [Trypanosoma brucei gambiense DAL972]